MNSASYQHMSKQAALLCAALLAAKLCGCNTVPQPEYEKLGLVEISGTVTFDGAPLADASIKFESPDKTYCTGITDSSGHYRMMLDSRKSGVIPGQKIVRISSRKPAGEGGGAVEEDPDAKPKANDEKVPECYNKKSQLKIEVKSADSGMDFNLKSDCSTKSFE
ncbi:MAG: carboxypeptidase regulatory-like domain-containing protein [Pirellulales bacterium]